VRPNLRQTFQFIPTTRRTFTSACLFVCAPGRTLAAAPRGTLIIASKTKRATSQRRMRSIHRHSFAPADHSNEGQPSSEAADRLGVRLANGVSHGRLGAVFPVPAAGQRCGGAGVVLHISFSNNSPISRPIVTNNAPSARLMTADNPSVSPAPIVIHSHTGVLRDFIGATTRRLNIGIFGGRPIGL
jgi:hypothetical protein